MDIDSVVSYFSIIPTYVLPFLIILTTIVFVHEFGHYLLARYNGVHVEVFSVGFGHELFGYTDPYGTRWKFSAIPLGGYVKMFGEVDVITSLSSRESLLERRSISFRYKRVGQRASIVAAGPVMNFVFAITIFTVAFAIFGQPLIPPVVSEVKVGSAAEMAGIQVGDCFLTIDGRTVKQFSEIQQAVYLSNGTSMEVRLRRANIEFVLMVKPQMNVGIDYLGNMRRMPILGISVSTNGPIIVRQYTTIGALIQSLRETYNTARTSLIALGQVMIGTRDTDELSGILRIAHFSGLAVQEGMYVASMFVATLSINLGVINLFPIPLLDGGLLLFYFLEGIRGKPLSERIQEYSSRVGMILVFGLMILATWNDLVQLRVWDALVDLIS